MDGASADGRWEIGWDGYEYGLPVIIDCVVGGDAGVVGAASRVRYCSGGGGGGGDGAWGDASSAGHATRYRSALSTPLRRRPVIYLQPLYLALSVVSIRSLPVLPRECTGQNRAK